MNKCRKPMCKNIEVNARHHSPSIIAGLYLAPILIKLGTSILPPLNSNKINKNILIAINRNVKYGLPKLKDRKSTRLNSSHVWISYAVFCLKKKKKIIE